MLQQQAQKLPPQVSTVTVAQDDSENHIAEAGWCFEWLNSTEGVKFHNGTPKQRKAFENVKLHRSEHMAVAKMLAAQNAPPEKPPSESLSAAIDKLPPNIAIQALKKMGITASPTDFAQHDQNQVDMAVQKKAIPEALKQQ